MGATSVLDKYPSYPACQPASPVDNCNQVRKAIVKSDLYTR